MLNIKPTFRPDAKISIFKLLILFLISLISFILFQAGIQRKPYPDQKQMIAAARQVQLCQAEIRKVCDSLSIEVSQMQDPLQTGLIGLEFSPITTTLGNIESKQVSTNPDFAALFIRWFDQLELRKGDDVVIHASASFPALIISAICAAETYRLKPIILSSAGASSFGANRPELTWWDMESILFTKGLINHRTCFATPGGQNDNGSSLWDGGLKICVSAAERNGLNLIVPADYFQSVNMKWKFIQDNIQPALFINIGGNQSGMGNYPSNLSIPVGFIETRLSTDSTAGLIQKFNNQNIPVIHLLQIRDIAAENGLGSDIASFTSVGKSDVYFFSNQSKTLTSFAILLVLGSWLGFYLTERLRKTTCQDSGE
ncbi:MAG: poly-gamma-glutamate system protein [Calditrichaceae bacterium]|nr:poly-gamma-glutamate system protein [Calditrichaceae bacterium]HES58825.1 poly-gamma-glutamate system protein [Caldithrix sp.]